MNCQIFETVVNDLAREQMMEANAREQALAHSGACESCALRLEDERMLTFGLRALATEMNSAKASYRVEEQLLAAFRGRSLSHLQARATTRWSYHHASRAARLGTPVWIVVAAAVLLIVFGIAGMRLRLAEPPAPETSTVETAGIQTPPKDSETIVEASSTASLSTRKGKQSSGRRRRNDQKLAPSPPNRDATSSLASVTAATANTGSREREVATEFMPLGYVSPINLQEGGQIVRVELPRSAMVSLGLAVNMDRYSERVKADVLVGADGLARAIRFVQ